MRTAVSWFCTQCGVVGALFGAKLLCQSVFLRITLRQAGRRESLAVLAYTLWPRPIEWKERRYRWAEA